MRKALATAGLAAMLSMGIGTSAVAHASGVHASQEVVEVKNDSSDNELDGKIGLIGLVGLFGLAGFARGGGGKNKGGSGGRAYSAPKAPKGGHTTDWSR